METLDVSLIWSNQVVLRNIFKFLSTRDLMTLSLVNKLWYYETRCFLRDCRKSVALINDFDPCTAALLFSNALERMNIIPYNGLSIIIDNDYHHIQDCMKDPEAKAGARLSSLWTKMKLKFLRVDISPSHYVFDCPLAQQALTAMTTSATLEHLHVVQVPTESTMPLKFLCHDDSLKKLKYLEVDGSLRSCESRVIASILSSASNLREIKSAVAPNFLPMVPHSSYNSVKSLCAHTGWDRLTEFAAVGPQLQNLQIRCVFDPAYWQDIWKILQSSRVSLESIEVDQKCAKLLKQTQWEPLCNVKRFRLSLTPSSAMARAPSSSLQREFLFDSSKLEEWFELEHLYPHASSVSLVTLHMRFGRIRGERPVLGLQWPRVTQLTVETRMGKGLSNHLRFKFPSVRDLTAEEALSNRYLWSHWSELEELKIVEEPATMGKNWDATFCGIYPQEAEYLQTQDDEFLQSVHIVPPFPAVNNLKNLRKLRIAFTLYKPTSKAFTKCYGPPELNFVSKVTTLVAFKRMRDLQVELHTEPKFADDLNHLKSLLKSTKVQVHFPWGSRGNYWDW